MIQIKEMFESRDIKIFESRDLIKFIETKRYKVIGVPFFNQLDENKFKEELLKSIS